MSEDESRIRLAEIEGELEDLRNRVADLEKVSVKFSRTERMIEQLRPLLRTMTQLMAQLVKAAKQLASAATGSSSARRVAASSR